MTYPVFCGAIVITSANNGIRMTEGATTSTKTIAAGTYYLRGDGAAGDFLPALKTALESGASANVYTPTVSRNVDAGVAHTTITITRSSGADDFRIAWADALTTFDAALVGFTANTALDATAKTSTQACAACWVGNDVVRESEAVSTRVVAVTENAAGGVQGVSRSARKQRWRVVLAFVAEARMKVEAALAVDGDTLEGFMERFGAGAAFEYHLASLSSGVTLAALSSSTLVSVVHFSQQTLEDFDPPRIGPGVALYALDLLLHKRVAS